LKGKHVRTKEDKWRTNGHGHRNRWEILDIFIFYTVQFMKVILLWSQLYSMLSNYGESNRFVIPTLLNAVVRKRIGPKSWMTARPNTV